MSKWRIGAAPKVGIWTRTTGNSQKICSFSARLAFTPEGLFLRYMLIFTSNKVSEFPNRPCRRNSMIFCICYGHLVNSLLSTASMHNFQSPNHRLLMMHSAYRGKEVLGWAPNSPTASPIAWLKEGSY